MSTPLRDETDFDEFLGGDVFLNANARVMQGLFRPARRFSSEAGSARGSCTPRFDEDVWKPMPPCTRFQRIFRPGWTMVEELFRDTHSIEYADDVERVKA